MNCDLVIFNGKILTVDPDFTVIDNGMLGVDNGRISWIEKDPGENFRPQAKRNIDACGGIVMPGLVNSHVHMPMTLFRGMADDLPLATWLHEHIFPAEAAHINHETVVTGSLLAAAEMLLSGTTTCCDGYFHEDGVAEAIMEAGMRGVLGHGIIDFPAPGVPDPEKNIKTAVEFAHRWLGKHESITPSLVCHSPYTCSSETLKKAKLAAKDMGVIFQTHASETKQEHATSIKTQGMSPVKYLDKLGVLDENTILAHCVWMDDDEIKILKDSGTKVSHNPSSNMKLASGTAPVDKMIDLGLAPSLGTDGCASNNTLDMFRDMNITAKLHKVSRLDPTLLPAETVIRMATIYGAKALGLDAITGTLEKGKAADIIILDTEKPHLTPMYNPISHVVYAVNGADVRHVIIGGKQIVKDREILTVNTMEVMQRAREKMIY